MGRAACEKGGAGRYQAILTDGHAVTARAPGARRPLRREVAIRFAVEPVQRGARGQQPGRRGGGDDVGSPGSSPGHARQASAASRRDDLQHFLTGCAVTALCFSPGRQTLSWGDDLGRIVIWNVAPLLDALPAPQPAEEAPDATGKKKPPPPRGKEVTTASAFVVAAAAAAAGTPTSCTPTATDGGAAAGGARLESSGSKPDLLGSAAGALLAGGEGFTPATPTAGAGRGGGLAGLLAGGKRDSMWLVGKLQKIKIKMVHVWQAHRDSVSSLQSIAEPAALFS